MTETKKPKAIEERDVKSCTVEIVGKRFALNPDTLKAISAYFHLTGTFSIEETKSKKYAKWRLTKIIAPFKFSWMQTWGVRTRVYLHDDCDSTFPLNPLEEQQTGVDFSVSEPKRITSKEAEELIAKGAITAELDEDDKLRSLPIAKFSRK